MRQLVYLTFNDLPGGIFTSQVVEVCKYLSKECNAKVTLVCLISRRGFSVNKARILELFPDAVVLPMFPGIGNWKLNRFALKRKFKSLNPDLIIARGPFATLLAKQASQSKVCFDARGAYKAEFAEYDVSSGKFSAEDIQVIEKEALTTTDFRIAVSGALVEYWKKEYNFSSSHHVVIPCTLASGHEIEYKTRTENPKKVRIVFSGGNGKWQSLDLVSKLLVPYFERNQNAEMIFLTNSLPVNFELKNKFPDRVQSMWLKESEVHAFLSSCDYGWLFRENTTTNKVASPVKFAEYLAAGLSVLISPELGDFSQFVQEHKCGMVLTNTDIPELITVSTEEKKRNIQLARAYFTKEQFNSQYRRVVACE